MHRTATGMRTKCLYERRVKKLSHAGVAVCFVAQAVRNPRIVHLWIHLGRFLASRQNQATVYFLYERGVKSHTGTVFQDAFT